jgi:DNA-binding MarR family transcriptional regulator
MARPQGPLAVGVIAEISARGPLAARELAAHLGVSVKTVVNICHQMVSSGRLQLANKDRFPNARRRLAVYSCPSIAPAATSICNDLFQGFR